MLLVVIIIIINNSNPDLFIFTYLFSIHNGACPMTRENRERISKRKSRELKTWSWSWAYVLNRSFSHMPLNHSLAICNQNKFHTLLHESLTFLTLALKLKVESTAHKSTNYKERAVIICGNGEPNIFGEQNPEGLHRFRRPRRRECLAHSLGLSPRYRRRRWPGRDVGLFG